MQKPTGRRTGRLFCCVLMILGMATGVFAADASPAFPRTTRVSDVVYRADGSPASGWMVITWPAFVTADGAAVAAGSRSVRLGTDGTFDVALAPNAGGSPTGTYYSVTLKLDGGASSKESWVVPATSPATLGSVRAAVVPSSMAIQALTSDWANANLVNLASAQSISGNKSFLHSPSVPDPVNATDAANKEYVDAASASGAELARVDRANTWLLAQNFSVPPSAPSPVNDLDVANRAYVLQNAGASPNAQNIFSKPQAAQCMNGRCNESLYPGATLGQRLANACNQYSGKVGIVQIPVTETDTSFAPSAVQEGCIIEDERGIVIPGNGGFTIATGTAAPRSILYFQQRNTATSTCCTNPSIMQLYMEANSGGFNTWNGSSGTKTNFIPLIVDLMARTPGQHIGIGSTVYNFSGQGDTIPYSAVNWCNGTNNTGGDEACKIMSSQGFGGLPALTGTVTAINGNTLTIRCGANCNQLGEQTSMVVTSRDVYSTGTASIAGTPPTITGTGTAWSSVCSGATSHVFFEFAGETNHMVVPATNCASDSSIQLALVGEGANVNYNGKITSGAYKLYAHGSNITSVPYTGGQFSTIYATVADATQFQVGDSILQAGSPQISMFGVTVNLVQNVPFNPNSGSVIFGGQSSGPYPVHEGLGLSGNFYNAPILANWQGFSSTPIYGSYLGGAQPGNSYYYANDPAGNNTERLLGTQNSAGATHYISYDRTGGNNEWGMDALNIGMNGAAIGNVIHGSANTTFWKYVSATNSATYTADRATYGSNPNNGVWIQYAEGPGGKWWGIQSSGNGAATMKLGLGSGMNFYSDNMNTQTASINAATGAAAFTHLNQSGGHDVAGTIAIASGTSASANFSTPFNSTPICTLTPTSDPTIAGGWWVTTTSNAITANLKNAATITFNYVCVGNPN